MPLVLRLRHALGDTRFTLEATTVDAPHIVGRGKESAVQVPSLEVSSTHCALFVYDSQWCVQDANSRGGTFVNGLRTPQPVILSPGDVVTLGRSGQSATLQIEAATEGPLTDEDALPLMKSAVAPAAGGENIFAPAEVPFTAPAAAQHRRRKKSKGPLVFGIIATVLIVGVLAGAAWFLTTEKNRQAAKPTPPSAPLPSTRRSMFDLQADTGPVASVPRANAKTTAGITSPDAVPTDAMLKETSPPEPERDDPAWRFVLETADNPAAAVGALVDYKTAHPQSPLLAEVDQRLDTALDALWWQRVANIFTRRVSLKQEVVEATQERSTIDVLARGPIDDRIKRLAAADAALSQELKEMKFIAGAPIDTFDDKALANARAQRDAPTFAAWKQRVLRSASSRRGELPWD